MTKSGRLASSSAQCQSACPRGIFTFHPCSVFEPSFATHPMARHWGRSRDTPSFCLPSWAEPNQRQEQPVVSGANEQGSRGLDPQSSVLGRSLSSGLARTSLLSLARSCPVLPCPVLPCCAQSPLDAPPVSRLSSPSTSLTHLSRQARFPFQYHGRAERRGDHSKPLFRQITRRRSFCSIWPQNLRIDSSSPSLCGCILRCLASTSQNSIRPDTAVSLT